MRAEVIIGLTEVPNTGSMQVCIHTSKNIDKHKVLGMINLLRGRVINTVVNSPALQPKQEVKP